MDAEIAALTAAITQYGTSFTNLVAAISVGSEDLYRISPTGIAANSGVGADPDTIVSYITQLRDAIKNTDLSGAQVGHVDTWTAWVNGSNDAVINACDWIGMDAYPYFQNTMANGIDVAASLFNDALSQTQAAVGNKEVWITETGWPVSGSTSNLAVPSTNNAMTYWDQVGCPNFGKVNTWWFTLQDADPITPNPSFGIVGGTLTNTPLYDLSCAAVSSSSNTPPPSGTANQSPGSGSGSSVSSVSLPAATGAVASSGGGLSPAQGAGNGVGPNTLTTSATSPVGTGVSSNDSTTSKPSGTGVSNNGSTTSKPSGTGVSSNGSTISKPSGTGISSNGSTTSKPSGTGSSSGTSTAPLSASTNAATTLSGSVVGAIGALFAAIAAL
jgi:glucan endo-1,3-beta-D-glucosidase